MFTGEGRRQIRVYGLDRPRALWLLLWLTAGVTVAPLFFMVAWCAMRWVGLSGVALMAVGWGAGVVGGVLCFAPRAAADVPVRLVKLTRGGGRLSAGMVVGLGALPWFLPEAVRLPGSVGFPLLCLEWLISAVVFAVVAALVLPGPAVRGTAVAVLLVVVLAWMPLRQWVITSADAAALDSFGGPPRELVRVIDWPGAQPYSHGYAHATMTIEYDFPSLLPIPGGGDYGTLTVRQAESPNPCVALLATVADGGPAPACRSLGAGLWSTSDCALALQTGGVLVQLVESDCVPGEETTLESIIRTQRPAADLELLSIGR
ncbi:hypothetical protein [Streptacidiphilus sp. MAP12-16]|uniref:hypothetical protein n=1 Tax=Streptacidiphilus sp. MAP12-16 TaxID=3156300 RepID=UPI003514D9E0